MTNDMLSQEEIDALLNGGLDTASDSQEDEFAFDDDNDMSFDDNESQGELSSMEIDALGEIGNISMGTSATTLFTLLGQKVLITTPKVEVTRVDELAKAYPKPYVAVDVRYKIGLKGSNMLVLKENDVKIIADLMMGGDGKLDVSKKELDEMDMSAISEAMNQMVGSSSTSLSEMFDKKIDIAPPRAHSLQFDNGGILGEDDGLGNNKEIVKISFRMVIGDLIDSEIMQLLPISFAKNMLENLFNVENTRQNSDDVAINQKTEKTAIDTQPSISYNNTSSTNNNINESYQQPRSVVENTPVNVKKVSFDAFDGVSTNNYNEGISMIENIPVEITVELGRTNRKISEILEFGPGTIIELDKLVGEPLEILANGKYIAKGEVVVVDDNFGIRVTDIVNPSKRVGK